jgi:hypothetical protein
MTRQQPDPISEVMEAYDKALDAYNEAYYNSYTAKRRFLKALTKGERKSYQRSFLNSNRTPDKPMSKSPA